MAKVIFDIETVGRDFEALDASSQEYLLKYADTEEEAQTIKESLSFYPLTAQIVAIGMLNPDTDNGIVYFQDPLKNEERFKENNIEFIAGSEEDILKAFWQTIKSYEQFITFNGRSFDCPFIMVRSAILRVKPTKDLMPYRYDSKIHIDLLDLLTFHGAVRKKFNLHMWCKAFGIKSPKEEGVTGYDVKNLFKEGRFLDIAKYCLGDLRATKELYFYWDRYIKL